MDNDAKLLQTARNLYKDVRFVLKYRGVKIADAEAGNEEARAAILAGEPWLFARCGATEMRTVAECRKNAGQFSEKAREDIQNLSGVFPTDDETLRRFCDLYTATAQSADLLALWDVGDEREVIKGCGAKTQFTKLRALEPYYHKNPWSTALAGKKVLVVHPFKRTILSQYQKRAQLFPGTEVLPEFASLTVVQAVQGLAGQATGYPSWFDALAAMQAEMDAADYEVAIVGAGAYGLPLAAHARDTGHVAVQMSGATQLLFGIKGQRWDDHPVISGFYNAAWVRPAAAEAPQNKQKVEGGSYW